VTRLAVLLAVLGSLALAGAAPACGCGAFIPSEPGAGGRVSEWSLVAFDGAHETILMRLSLGQPLDDAALVLPVRPGASVALGSDAAFDRLGARTAPRVEERKRYHLGFEDGGGDLDGATAGAPGAVGGRGVEVLDSKALGPLDVVTLRSRSTAALEAWLRDHDFPLPDGLAVGTLGYLDDGWDLVVARLRPEAAGTPVVELQPLAITFPTDRPVYPLRLSRLAAAGSSARVDLLAPWKAAVEGYGEVAQEAPGRPPAPGAALVYAGRVAAGDLGAALPAGFLTTFRFTIAPSSPDRDPSFTRADDDRPYRQVRIVYEDVYLGGTIVSVAALLLLAGAGLWLARRRRLSGTRR
jgi:hypothetical protein